MRLRLCLAATALALLTVPAFAADLQQPEGPVLLTVTGAIANTNGDGTARFDLAMLEALASRTATLQTPWYESPQTFSGPLGAALLEAVGAEGATLRVIAINDYAAEIPVTDFTDHATILASRLDGETLSVRDKGPLFVIYPFDAEPDLYNEVYFGRSVWQVVSIEVF